MAQHVEIARHIDVKREEQLRNDGEEKEKKQIADYERVEFLLCSVNGNHGQDQGQADEILAADFEEAQSLSCDRADGKQP